MVDDHTYSVALLVQIYLQTNHVDLAIKEIAAAKRWAQDSLLFNLSESWVGMRIVRTIPFLSPLYMRVMMYSLVFERTPQDNTIFYRVEKNTKQHSMSMKNLPPIPTPQHHSPSSDKLLQRFTWVVSPRLRLRFRPLLKSIPRTLS